MMYSIDGLFGLFWNLGSMELLVIAVIILLLFGNRVPSLMRSLGRGVTEFKKGVEDDTAHPDKKDDQAPK